MNYKHLKLIAFNDSETEIGAYWVVVQIPEREMTEDQLVDLIVRPMVSTVHNKMACEHDYGKYSIDNAASPLDPPKQHSWIKCVKCGAPA